MASILIGEVKPGMVLALDAQGPNGRLLLPKGMALSEKNIRILNIWGVSEVTVREEAAPGADLPDQDAQALERARTLVDELFSGSNPEREAVAELKRLRVAALAKSSAVGDAAVPRDKPEGPRPPKEPLAASARELVASDPGLASFPEVYFELQKALENPRCSAHHLAEVIGRDPALAARLLRLANSPFYGFSKRIDSLDRGVLLIGANELIQMAMGVSVMGMFEDMPRALITVSQVWEHAIGCGVFARILASRLPGQSQERAFVAGLLHDVGRLILLRRLPGRMTEVMDLARRTKRPLYQVERELLGFDHAEVGAEAMRLWTLPPSLVETVRAHHDPDGLRADQDARLVHLADLMTIAFDVGSNGSPYAPPLDDGAWEGTGLPLSVLAVAVAQADRQIRDIVSIFLKGARRGA